MRRSCLAASVLVFVTLLGACNRDETVYRQAEILTGGNPRNGPAAIGRYGCGSCHTIANVRSAVGTVGPPLTGIASRGYLAGRLPNSPDNMMRWIQHPQQIEKGNVMPEMGVTDTDARDITAFLYTLR
jgi:cytochrome c2